MSPHSWQPRPANLPPAPPQVEEDTEQWAVPGHAAPPHQLGGGATAPGGGRWWWM